MIDGDAGNSFSADAITTLMDGRGGNDTLDGRGVNGITLLGGAGDDTLKNGYLIRGGDGNDFIDGYGGPGFYYGEAGDDFIYYYYTDPVGDSIADGGSGRDVIFGSPTGITTLSAEPTMTPSTRAISSSAGTETIFWKAGTANPPAGRPWPAALGRVPGVPPITPPSATMGWVAISRMTNVTVHSHSRLR